MKSGGYVGTCARCGKKVRRSHVKNGKHTAVAMLLIEDTMTRRIPCGGIVA